MDNNCVKCPDPVWLMSHNQDTGFDYVHCDFGETTLGQGRDTLGSETKTCGKYPEPTWGTVVRTKIFTVCTTTLTLETWPLVKIMTLFGHGQQLCEISKSNIVRSYDTNIEFYWVCTMILEIIIISSWATCVKVWSKYTEQLNNLDFQNI